MEAKDLFCNICLMQFDGKFVFDIHMSFVHKIGKKQPCDEKVTKIKEEGNGMMDKTNQESTGISKQDEATISREPKVVKDYKCSICNYIPNTKEKMKATL